MYDDFKMCDGVEFDKIAKEYYKKNKAQILDLSGDTKYNKEEFKDILNLSKNLYFDFKQKNMRGFDGVIKNIKSTNLELADIYKNKFKEEFIPEVNNCYNLREEKGVVELIKRLIKLLNQCDFDDLRQSILKYLDILSDILDRKNKNFA